MEEIVWSLVSLVIAGAALTVIVTPITVGVGRCVSRAVRSPRRYRPAASPPSTCATPTTTTTTTAERLRALGGGAETAQEAQGALETVGTRPQPMADMDYIRALVDDAVARAAAQRPASISPLERALTASMRARQVPSTVLAECQAGTRLTPGQYPLLSRDGALEPEQLAAIFDEDSWVHSRVQGAAPAHPMSNVWN